MLTAADVTDAPASFVADPFLLTHGGSWHLFFEVMNRETGRGEIAHAESADGLDWTYRKIVLTEPFHLSYPHVFRHDGEVFLLPEARRGGSVRLYRADPFPERWVLSSILLEGAYVDSSLLLHRDRWWLFTQPGGRGGLHLFHSRSLESGWRRHPASPVLPDDRRITRSAGRITRHRGRLLRFVQDGVPSYGYAVRVLEIDQLSPAKYRDHEVEESPILQASKQGWNAISMHHVDPRRLPSGEWIAAVDGADFAFC